MKQKLTQKEIEICNAASNTYPPPREQPKKIAHYAWIGGIVVVIAMGIAANNKSNDNPINPTPIKFKALNESDAIKSGNVWRLMEIADNYRFSGNYDDATRLYLIIAIERVSEEQAVIALVKLAKYCYPNISTEKQQALDNIFGDDFHTYLKRGEI